MYKRDFGLFAKQEVQTLHPFLSRSNSSDLDFKWRLWEEGFFSICEQKCKVENVKNFLTTITKSKLKKGRIVETSFRVLCTQMHPFCDITFSPNQY